MVSQEDPPNVSPVLVDKSAKLVGPSVLPREGAPVPRAASTAFQRTLSCLSPHTGLSWPSPGCSPRTSHHVQAKLSMASDSVVSLASLRIVVSHHGCMLLRVELKAGGLCPIASSRCQMREVLLEFRSNSSLKAQRNSFTILFLNIFLNIFLMRMVFSNF